MVKMYLHLIFFILVFHPCGVGLILCYQITVFVKFGSRLRNSTISHDKIELWHWMQLIFLGSDSKLVYWGCIGNKRLIMLKNRLAVNFIFLIETVDNIFVIYRLVFYPENTLFVLKDNGFVRKPCALLWNVSV